MPSFDYLVAKMRCGRCGAVSEADASTDMQAKIALHHTLRRYGVGDAIELYTGKFEDCGYLCLRKPVSPDSFSFIQPWDCPACDKTFNWALITISKQIIISINELELADVSPMNTNYVSEWCRDMGWKIQNGRLVDRQPGLSDHQHSFPD